MSMHLSNTFLLAMVATDANIQVSEERYQDIIGKLEVSRDGVSIQAEFAPVMVGDYGIEQLEDITDALVVAAQVYVESMSNGKLDVFDAFNLTKMLEPINEVNDGKEVTGKEAFDLFDQESTALIESTVRKAERLTDDAVTLSVVKQVARIVFGSLTLASIIKRKQNAAA